MKHAFLFLVVVVMGASLRAQMSPFDGSYCVLVKIRADNLPASKNTALQHVIGLLVDADVPSYGHRYAILNKSFQYIGVAVRTFPSNRYCMVQNFSTARYKTE